MKPLYILLLLLIALGSVAVIYGILTRPSTQNVTEVHTTTNNTATTATDKKEYIIIAFGDSLTAGYGISLEDSYPSILEQELQKTYKNIRIVNMGVSGETTTGGLERVPFVLSQNPSLVLLGLGANDMLRATPPSITKENLTKILTAFKEQNIPVVILGMRSQLSNGPVYRQEFDAIYPALAKQFNTPLVPFFLEGVALRQSLNISDGIHPNRQGYERIIDENILPILLPTLKKNYIE